MKHVQRGRASRTVVPRQSLGTRGVMISRVAEHCFWMSRYLERAENTARVLDVNQTLLLDFHVPAEQQWQPLLIISGIADFLIFDLIFPRSVRRCLLYCQESSYRISGRKKHQPGNDAEKLLENL